MNRPVLRPGGALIRPDAVDEAKLQNKRSLNVALLGTLAAQLDLPEAEWLAAIRAALPARLHAVNEAAFRLGRTTGQVTRG